VNFYGAAAFVDAAWMERIAVQSYRGNMEGLASLSVDVHYRSMFFLVANGILYKPQHDEGETG